MFPTFSVHTPGTEQHRGGLGAKGGGFKASAFRAALRLVTVLLAGLVNSWTLPPAFRDVPRLEVVPPLVKYPLHLQARVVLCPSLAVHLLRLLPVLG
jgi:hypothetical protein